MDQELSFSGVGAKHQNGVAERNVKTISYLARANLIHSAISWPDQHDLELWPFAFDYSVYIFNNIPGVDGLAPEEKWTGVKFQNYDHLRRMHPWGCPSYVLNPVMQDGKKLPKWKPRSRQGKFLGLSKEHATSVGLILNPTTKRISPQFHLLYDDFFSTVQSIDRRDVPHVSEEDWEFLFRQGTEMSYDPHERDPALQPPPISNEWLEQDEIGRHDELRRDQRERARIHREKLLRTNQLRHQQQAPSTSPSSTPSTVSSNGPSTSTSNTPPVLEIPRPIVTLPSEPTRHQRERNTTSAPPTVVEILDDSDDESVQKAPPTEPSPPTSLPPRRTRRPNKKFFGDEWVTIMEKLQQDQDVDTVDVLHSLDLDKLMTFKSEEAAFNTLRKRYRQSDREQEFLQTLDWKTSMVLSQKIITMTISLKGSFQCFAYTRTII